MPLPLRRTPQPSELPVPPRVLALPPPTHLTLPGQRPPLQVAAETCHATHHQSRSQYLLLSLPARRLFAAVSLVHRDGATDFGTRTPCGIVPIETRGGESGKPGLIRGYSTETKCLCKRGFSLPGSCFHCAGGLRCSSLYGKVEREKIQRVVVPTRVEVGFG
jgi:hypothetical protein